MSSIAKELEDVDLGDRRLNRRAGRIVEAWSAAPSFSFPDVARSAAELEGLYGFVENPYVECREITAAHARATVRRVAEDNRRVCLCVHDTTTLEFPGEVHREGMGWLGPKKQGCHVHLSLLLSADGSRCPLGVVGVSTFMPKRPDPTAPKKKRSGSECAADPSAESQRWREAVGESTELLRGNAVVIHVMDREADAYALLSEMISKGWRFVVRARVLDRPVATADDGFRSKEHLRVVAKRAVAVTEREALLHRRRASKFADANKKHPPRAERIAKLEFAADRVRLQRPKYLSDPAPPTIDVHVVHVREVDAPDGVEPVEWLLVTTESIDTADDVLRVVDHYRARWTIEELNKAIKTGCRIEERQLESARALMIALALCIPIAWQMLALRHQSRHQPEAPADTVISNDRLEVLRAIAKKRLPAKPTARDVFLAIAALGGHLAKNGDPGWITLRKGLDKLLFAQDVRVALGRQEKDPADE